MSTKKNVKLQIHDVTIRPQATLTPKPSPVKLEIQNVEVNQHGKVGK